MARSEREKEEKHGACDECVRVQIAREHRLTTTNQPQKGARTLKNSFGAREKVIQEATQEIGQTDPTALHSVYGSF